MTDTCGPTDLVKSRYRWLLWGLPAVLLVAGGFVPAARLYLWTPALLIAGTACLVNAASCGRMHCYITGPLYLAAALATVLGSFDVLPISSGAVGLAVVGGTVLAFLPEWSRGPYIRSR